MDRQDYVIEVSHVSKSFKDNKVLKDVSLLCESGKIYGLVGHNGSGKTVLFKSICGFLSCDEGTITVNGKVMGKDKDMLTDAGIIIEDPGFLRTWSGYHNLEFLYTLRNKKNKDYLCSVLRKVGLDPALKRSVGKYSLGMRQRLALAQAIMEDPGILILDEPMNGLDKNGVREIRELLLKMKEENKLLTFDRAGFMEWQEISSAETAAAGNAPEMVDDTIYESLYAELKIKCNPNKFMVPYDKERVSQANELYRQLMETSPQNEETLRQLRSKAIKELGVCFSSKALFQFLCNTCHPRNFMSPYNAEKVEIANKLYAQVLEKAYNIEALENIQRSAKQLLGIKEFRNNEEGGDDVTGYVVLIYFGLSIILILILLAVGV